MRSRIAVGVTAAIGGATEFHLGRRTRAEGARKKAKGKVGRKKEKLRKDEGSTRLSGRRGQKFWETRITGERRDNEDTDINSNIGVTAHGVRPDGATTDNDAGADQGNRDDGAGEREENASRTGGAWQT